MESYDDKPVGRPPEGTLRRAISHAWHALHCDPDVCRDMDCGGRLLQGELAALETAASQWHMDRHVAGADFRHCPACKAGRSWHITHPGVEDPDV